MIDDIDFLRLASQLSGSLFPTFRALNATPAFGSRGVGYQETVSLLSQAMVRGGLTPEIISIPRSVLEYAWGPKLERARDYIPVQEFAERAIVFARLPGTNPSLPAVHLTQHFDLPGFFEIEGMDWVSASTEDWFESRGANQCRGGVMSLLVAAALVGGLRGIPRGDVYLSFTPDNHLGGETGAGYLVRQGIGRAPNVITGGASGPQGVILGYKGAGWLRVTVTGSRGLASQPHLAVNAIEKMRQVQAGLADLELGLSSRASGLPLCPSETDGATITQSRIESSGLSIPERCVLYVDVRVIPEDSLKSALDEIENVLSVMRGSDPQLDVGLEVLHAVDGVAVPGKARLPMALAESIRLVTRKEPVMMALPYYTEQRLFQSGWNAEVIGHGPGRSDAAEDDDRVSLSNIARSAAVVARSVFSLAVDGRSGQ